jgi:hypothetical protein
MKRLLLLTLAGTLALALVRLATAQDKGGYRR